MSQTNSDVFQKNKIMSNEPNKAPNAPADNAAGHVATPATEAKPEAIVTPAPAVAPVETKKS